MRFNSNDGSERWVKKFAWFPTRIVDHEGNFVTIWLETYETCNEGIYIYRRLLGSENVYEEMVPLF